MNWRCRSDIIGESKFFVDISVALSAGAIPLSPSCCQMLAVSPKYLRRGFDSAEGADSFQQVTCNMTANERNRHGP